MAQFGPGCALLWGKTIIFSGSSPCQPFLKIYHHRHPRELRPESPLVMALGVYDGVHLGHQSILERVIHWRSEKGYHSAVFTFRSSMPKPGFERIMGSEQLYFALDKEGIESLHTLEFMDEIRKMDAKTFLVELLQKGLNVKHLVVGEGARLGHQRGTSSSELPSLGDEIGMNIEVIPVVQQGDEDLSSTRIRDHLRKGDLQMVEALLGHPYSVGGYVHRDQGKAREMGFPTANLSMAGRVTLPYGVYGAKAKSPHGPLKEERPALIYLGERPTVKEKSPVLEVHLPDWEGDLYGRYLEVGSFEFIRGEIAFSNLDELSKQISLDLDEVKKRWS